jgi:hypothetical protein
MLDCTLQLLQRAADIFGSGRRVVAPMDLALLLAKIGQRALENDPFARALIEAGLRRAKP